MKIDEVIDPSGYKRPAVVVNVDGDEWMEGVDRSTDLVKEIKLSQKEIVEKIHEMGIVGLGGATFPSHVKLMVPEGKKAEVLIINGVECEPYLTSDHRLMLEKGEEIMVGTSSPNEIRSRAIVSSTRPGSKPCMQCTRPPRISVGSTLVPPTWLFGATAR